MTPVPADPWSAAFGALGNAAAGGPSAAQSGQNTGAGGQDGAGWTVATGGARAGGGTVANGGGLPATVASLGGSLTQWAPLLLIGGAVLWFITRKR